MLPQADVTYAELNQLAGIIHDNPTANVGEGTGRGLKPGQIETILNHFKIAFSSLKHEPNHVPPVVLPDKVEYQALLYASIESARPALLGFELEADPATGEISRHLIPVIGHTFNDDAWVPDAERWYFMRDQVIFRSESWLSTYVVHDDNLGPYYCLPRHYLSRKSFRLLCGIQPKAASLNVSEVEALARSELFGTTDLLRTRELVVSYCELSKLNGVNIWTTLRSPGRAWPKVGGFRHRDHRVGIARIFLDD